MPPKMLSNKVNPLDWKVPIVDTSTGAPTPEFQRKWQQQAAANASITDLTTAAAVSAVIDLISSTVGALLVRGTNQWTGLVPVADGRVLRDKGVGATPIWDTISDILDTLGSVQGDVLYRDTAAWKVLAPGTAGQVLTTGGAAANPSWATSASGGGAVSSVNDDGTTFYLALMDADGQLILDGLGDPVFLPEVFPPAALPIPTSSLPGGVKALAAVAHNFLTSIDLTGTPTQAQPAMADVSDYATGTFTPIDTSGAGLTFTSNVGHWQKIGKLVWYWGLLFFPSTASGANVSIGGLPFTAANLSDSFVPGGITTNASIPGGANVINTANTTSFQMAAYVGGAAITNSQMSTAALRFAGFYPLP